MRAVCRAAAGQPVVMAGSIESAERIEAVIQAGAAGFTVGTAALEGVFPTGPGLADQLAYIRAVAERHARDLTPAGTLHR